MCAILAIGEGQGEENGYTKAMRIRNWAKRGVILLTPAIKWVKSRFAKAYHRLIKQPDNHCITAKNKKADRQRESAL